MKRCERGAEAEDARRGGRARQIDFDELPTYVGYQVRRTQAKIFAEFEATLADFDFTPGSFGVLTLIRANPGITQVALAAAFGVDKSTMSPVIVRLEKRGLVRREVLASDRRCHALYLRGGGRADVPGRAREDPRLRGRRGGAPDQARAARAGAAAGKLQGGAGQSIDACGFGNFGTVPESGVR